MNQIFKLPSKRSSSSSGSLKIINLNDVENIANIEETRKDLFDLLLDDWPLTLQSQHSLSFNKSQHNE